LGAIETLKTKIKEGKDVGNKEFNNIMMSGSKMGIEPKKGEKTKSTSKVINQIKAA
jgi:hypothetical protein